MLKNRIRLQVEFEQYMAELKEWLNHDNPGRKAILHNGACSTCLRHKNILIQLL